MTNGLPNFLAPPSNLFSFNLRESLFAASRAPSRQGSGHATAFFFKAQLEHTIYLSIRIKDVLGGRNGCMGTPKCGQPRKRKLPRAISYLMTEEEEEKESEEEERRRRRWRSSGVIQRQGEAHTRATTLTIEPHCCFTTVFYTFCTSFLPHI